MVNDDSKDWKLDGLILRVVADGNENRHSSPCLGTTMVEHIVSIDEDNDLSRYRPPPRRSPKDQGFSFFLSARMAVYFGITTLPFQ